MAEKKRIIVGISGASGAIYGIRTLEVLRTVADVETHLILSPSGAQTIAAETDLSLDQVRDRADVVHGFKDIGASISSGSFRATGLMVAPCSIKTMSNIAAGNTGDLISRAADVILKERRTLIVAIRETPLHIGHLENLTKLARIGAVIFPPVPAFYNRPASLQDIVDQSCMRMLDQLHIHLESAPRWGEEGGVPAVGQKIEGGKADNAG